jgi:hypothetical protein
MKGKAEMSRRMWVSGFWLFCLIFFLTGCPKKVPEPIFKEKKLVVNPVQELLDVLSKAEFLEARTSIRIDTVRKGDKMSFGLNGDLFYRKPTSLRLQGYLPWGAVAFDSLFRDGEFFLLIPSQKRAYEGELSQVEGVMGRAGPIQIIMESKEWDGIPRRIQIELIDKQTRIDLRLKNVVVNSTLPKDLFEWSVPDGVEVRPLSRLLKAVVE